MELRDIKWWGAFRIRLNTEATKRSKESGRKRDIAGNFLAKASDSIAIVLMIFGISQVFSALLPLHLRVLCVKF